MVYQIISEHTYFFNSSVVFFITIVLPCILLFVEMSRDLALLIDNSLKRGDVETEARSSVSPPSQVKMKLKLAAYR